MERTQHIDNLISTYFSGELTPGELKELREWIDESAGNRRHFLKMQEVWFSSISDSDAGRFDKDAAYRLFLEKTGETRKRRLSRKAVLRALTGAAAVVLIAVVSLFAYRQGSNRVKNLFSNIVIEAPHGSRTKLYLPDSTLVWLNAGSKITYSQGFGVSERKVYLTGEGYFEVVRNEKLPMHVITDELRVDVLGTTFNFRNYPDEEEIVVSLEKGKIVSRNELKAGQSFTLTPNQKVTLNKKTKVMVLSDVDAGNISGWIDGSLFFDEKLLPDIVRTLERSYGVGIRIADPSLNTFRFYGHFSRVENTIQEVLDRLVATDRLEYIIDGEDIVLIPKRK